MLYIVILLLFSFVEEGLWDSLVWDEHSELFILFSSIPAIAGNAILAIIVPLLSVPQITHYIIDGYIWKIKKDEYEWKNQILK